MLAGVLSGLGVLTAFYAGDGDSIIAAKATRSLSQGITSTSLPYFSIIADVLRVPGRSS
jgi:hypothetical protein